MEQISKKAKYASLALVIGPLLAPYSFPGTTVLLPTVFMLMNCVLFFFWKSPKRGFPKYYKIFLIYLLTIMVINTYTHGYSVKSSLVPVVLFSGSLLLYTPFIDLTLVKKYYRFFSFLAIAVLLLQESLSLLFGIRFSALIPFLPSAYVELGINSADFAANQTLNYRNCAFFLEPAHCAEYLLGYLAFALADNVDNKERFLSKDMIVVIIGLLILKSGTALLVSGLVTLLYFFLNQSSLKKKVFVVIVLLVGFFAYNEFSTSINDFDILQRSKELSLSNAQEERYASSGAIRIFMGYFVFDELPTLEKFTGIGLSGVSDFAQSTYLGELFERHAVNTIQAFLIGTGIIGLFLFLLCYINIFAKNSVCGVFLLMIFLLICFISSQQFTIVMLLYMVLGYKCKIQKIRQIM